MKQIDEKLWWKYIDGDCSEEEKLQLESLLEKDASLAEEMLLRTTLHQNMEDIQLESPSVDFTANVLAALPEKRTITEVAPLLSKRARWILIGISLLFVVSIFLVPYFLPNTMAETTTSSPFSLLSEAISPFLDNLIASLPSLPDVSIAPTMVQFAILLAIGGFVLFLMDHFMERNYGTRRLGL